MDFRQGGVGEPFEVDAFRTAKVVAGGFADGAGELGAADTADTFRLQGDGTGNLRIGTELSTVPCGGISGYGQGVVLFIPCIEA